MKQIFTIILILIFVTPHLSVAAKQKDHDVEIAKWVRKLENRPKAKRPNRKLKEHYHAANAIDIGHIDSLKRTGMPHIWYDAYQTYLKLDARQKLVNTLPVTVLQNIEFTHDNYRTDVEESKKKAAAYLYAHAQELMKKGGKLNGHQALEELLIVRELFGKYKNMDNMLRKALLVGRDKVLIELVNHSSFQLSDQDINNLLSFDLDPVEGDYIKYDLVPEKEYNYAYTIYLNIDDVALTPGRINKKRYAETKKVQDGWHFLMKEDGGMVLDSAGMAIQVPKYLEKRCNVTEINKYKEVKVQGSVNYYSHEMEQMVYSAPITASSTFDMTTTYVKGHLEACSKRSIRLNEQDDLQFPSDNKMFDEAGKRLSATWKKVIWGN